MSATTAQTDRPVADRCAWGGAGTMLRVTQGWLRVARAAKRAVEELVHGSDDRSSVIPFAGR